MNMGASDFAATMPPSYREAFSPAEIAEHAAIVSRRVGRAAHMEIWRALSNGCISVCVVAEDRAALLSLVSGVLVEFGFDVTSAEIYCRTPPEGPREAVDLFWIRSRDTSGKLRPITPEEVAAASERLCAVVENPSVLALSHRAEGEAGLDPIPASRVFFDVTVRDTPGQVLVVEGHDRPGLLHSVVRALHRYGVDIVASEVRTEGQRVRDRFTILGQGGALLSADERELIKNAVRKAMRAAERRQG
jgi:UTP:GlnB (protein PII) uridylyltransferase